MASEEKVIVMIPPLVGRRDWPKSVGTALLIQGEKVVGTSFFHQDQAVGEIANRVAQEHRLTKMPMVMERAAAPATVMNEMGSRFLQQEFVEDARDFLLNYEYSVSEGVPLPVEPEPEPEPQVTAPSLAFTEAEDEPEKVSSSTDLAQPDASESVKKAVPEVRAEPEVRADPIDLPIKRKPVRFGVPLNDVMIVEGATARKSVSGQLSIDLPLLTRVEMAEDDQVFVIPGTNAVMIDASEWPGNPGTIILPISVARVLHLGDLPAPVDISLMPGCVVVKNPGHPAHPGAVYTVGTGDFADLLRQPPKPRTQVSKKVVFYATLAAATAMAFLLVFLEPKETESRTPVDQIREEIFAPRP